MKISIAHALKEKNLLKNEINQLWELFQSENSCLETHKRRVDVKKTLKLIGDYSAKLVDLKTKIGNANSAEHIRNIHLLDETKNRLVKLSETKGSEDSDYEYRSDRETKRTAIFNEEMLLAMQHQLQLEANHLQDKIDAFNAETHIEFESPLK